MNSNLLYIFTRTPLHVGSGSSVGAIDQPVIRERHTSLPIIPGSSMKGVFADDFLEWENGRVLKDNDRNTSKRGDDAARIFGLSTASKEDSGKAGSLSFGEARILAFPVKSARGCFAWLTCPLVLSRWIRDLPGSINKEELLTSITPPKTDEAFYCKEEFGENAIFEDLVFKNAGEFQIAAELQTACPEPVWANHASKKLVLVSDEVMSHFCQTTCEVAQHVVIDDETGTAKKGLLFNQENVPAETLFFSSIYGEKEDFSILAQRVGNITQFGGNASTGLGYCSLTFNGIEEA